MSERRQLASMSTRTLSVYLNEQDGEKHFMVMSDGKEVTLSEQDMNVLLNFFSITRPPILPRGING